MDRATCTRVVQFTTAMLLLLGFVRQSEAIELSQCVGPLGMESKEIPDSDLTASSSFDIGNVGPQNARVRQEILGGAWCPKNQITAEAKEWLQIDLHTVHIITGTETQGRFGNGRGAEFAEAYLISYWRPELNRWVRYRDHTGNEVMEGNINTYLAAKTKLNPPIFASKLRILPYSYHKRTVCLRVEIYGCPFQGGLLSYEMPQGGKRGENWNFFDHTYDGVWEGNLLKQGLGQLTDGRGGPADFKDDFYGHERGKGWLGWKNDSRSGSDPVEIVFKFDSVREFDSIEIQVSNQFSKEVQVFSELRAYFSIGGKIYSGDPIIYKTKEDCIFETPKTLTFNLHQRVGRFLKIQLFWATKWILISEVDFKSKLSMNKYEEEVEEEKIITTPIPPNDNSILVQRDESLELLDEKNESPNNPLLHQTHSGSDTVGQISSLESESSTIVITAMISSFVAIFMVAFLILAALVVRNKLCLQGKDKKPQVVSSYSSSHAGDYDQPNQENGTILGKNKLPSGGGPEYQEPFSNLARSNLSSFSSGTKKSGTGSYHSNGNGNKAEYYSCTLISNPIPPVTDSCNEYDYAVPNELGKLLPEKFNTMKNELIGNGHTASTNRLVHLRLKDLKLPRIPKQHVRTLKKLGDGAFGTVYVGELANRNHGVGKELVTLKYLPRNASDKDKLDFLEEIRLLSSLKDPNIAQVLGTGTSEADSLFVVLEFLELGDLCQFLRENDALMPSTKKLGAKELTFIASQIASGMKFMESRNIVHRDLATRNIVIGRDLMVKVSHFATDTDLYSYDYYKLDGKMPLPIRWMAWESLFLGKYSTKSDVWSFGVTLWEIFSYSRHSPYPQMSNQELLHNLRRLSIYDIGEPFEPLGKPHYCPRDIYQLMCDTWRRDDEERPSFWEIHAFLSRKSSQFISPPVDPVFNAAYSHAPQYMV